MSRRILAGISQHSIHILLETHVLARPEHLRDADHPKDDDRPNIIHWMISFL